MRLIGLAALCLVAALSAAKPSIADSAFLSLSSHDLTSTEGLTYRIIVAPPSGPKPAAGYPVIYVMDGNAWTPMAAEVIRTNLDFGQTSKVEPAVVVGVGYPIDGVFDMKRRDWDLTTPTSVPAETEGSDVGGYEAMIRFLQERVKPDIEKRFPIDRKRQTLAGHSLGGLFTLRTLMNHPDWFQTYVAMSPSIWWNDAALLKEAPALKPSPSQRAARVYIGVGELEQYISPAYRMRMEASARKRAAGDPTALGGKTAEAYVDYAVRSARMVDNARDMAKVLGDKGLEVRFDLFPEEDHFSVLPSQLGRAIPFALRK
jgi:predicted alpha/beta superfamily hydrolase